MFNFLQQQIHTSQWLIFEKSGGFYLDNYFLRWQEMFLCEHII